MSHNAVKKHQAQAGPVDNPPKTDEQQTQQMTVYGELKWWIWAISEVLNMLFHIKKSTQPSSVIHDSSQNDEERIVILAFEEVERTVRLGRSPREQRQIQQKILERIRSLPTALSIREYEHAISQIARDVRQEVQLNISSEHPLKDLAGSWQGNDAEDLLELVQKTRSEI